MTLDATCGDEILRVLHVVLSLDVGGLERVVLRLLAEGQRHGHLASVLCLERPGVLAAEVERVGGRIYCLNKRPGFRPDLVFTIARLLKQFKPHIIHSHQIGCLLYSGPASRLVGTSRIVHTQHGKDYSNHGMRRVGRIASRFADCYCCVSKDIAREVGDARIVSPCRIVVVPNGVAADDLVGPADARARRGDWSIPEKSPVIGTIGRLTPIKRHDLLLEAFARLRKRRPDAHLVLVGDGPSRRSLAQAAEGLGIACAVHFTGHQPHPERFLRLINVFALTSESEGMPLALLEAWAAGLPVVAFGVGGLPEIIDGDNGVLVPFGDCASLSVVFEDLLRDPGRARLLGDAGRRDVMAHYSSEAMARHYHLLYEKLLRTHHG